MNELRRKLVLSTPFLTMGLLSACGDGEEGGPSNNGEGVNGRATAQATSSSTGQTLCVSALNWYSLVDEIWWPSKGGGFYFVPSATPAIQAVINGSVLYLSIFESVTLPSTVKIIKSMSMALALPSSGTALKANAVYTIDGTNNTAQIRLLKRTTTGASITDEAYAYAPSASGTVKIASITPVAGGDPLFKLTFSTVKFQAVAGSRAENPFTISGDTTLSTPTETADWV